MVRSSFVVAAALTLGFAAADAAFAEDTVKIGFILPMTGQQQSTGKQEAAGAMHLPRDRAAAHRLPPVGLVRLARPVKQCLACLRLVGETIVEALFLEAAHA